MLTSDDTWFRPSDICAAPDGSVYVSDWNDAGVGGHNMADQKRADMTGRIFGSTDDFSLGKSYCVLRRLSPV